MKDLFAFFIFIFSVSTAANGQNTKPQLLKGPANWEFERFTLPPVFAPDFPYKGAEELRFSPGMFNKDSANYFTYAFVAQLDDITAISPNEIRDYLLKYYKGLCNSTAKDRKLVIDTTKITAAIEKKKGTAAKEIIYNGAVNLFGVFADGAPVKLNIEVKVLMDTAAKRTYLVIIASPLEKTDALWKKLYEIQREFKIPG
jgi:hypothetical protein